MIRITTLLRRVLVAAAAVAAIGAVLVPAQANAAFTIGGPPTGAVTNAESGTIWYLSALWTGQAETPHASGWAADPDNPLGPISVSADVTWSRTMCWTRCWSQVVGQSSLTQTANLWESATATGTIWGPNHGFWFDLPTFSGTYDSERVCVTAINVGYGGNTSLGCYDVKAINPN